MVVGALLGFETLTRAQDDGRLHRGVSASSPRSPRACSAAPVGAWRGEAIMTGAVVCMAFYNVCRARSCSARARSAFLPSAWAPARRRLVIVGLLTGSIVALKSFGTAQWIAGVYLGVGGGALAFILWVLALQRATPTRVANTMTVNPIAAALLATQLVGEPITPQPGRRASVAVFAGIWIATSQTKPA